MLYSGQEEKGTIYKEYLGAGLALDRQVRDRVKDNTSVSWTDSDVIQTWGKQENLLSGEMNSVWDEMSSV